MPHRSASPYLAPLLSPPQYRRQLLLSLLWAAAALWFWIWWLNPAHVDTEAG